MPLRNPFRRAGGPDSLDDAPRSATDRPQHPSVKPLQTKEPTEYKLSEINDSGVYLPPSPTHEKPSFWHSKSNISITSSNHRSLLSETEPFSISRESFESYRRSFDISARSPIAECLDARPRQSLDARTSLDARRSLDVRRSRAPPRSSMQSQRPDLEAPTAEEDFEDVRLHDDPKPPKKRGIFSRFGDNNNNNNNNNEADANKDDRTSSGHHHFNFTGRKRAQSGQGSELKSMSTPTTPNLATEVPVEAR